jgi:hypothetical protein
MFSFWSFSEFVLIVSVLFNVSYLFAQRYGMDNRTAVMKLTHLLMAMTSFIYLLVFLVDNHDRNIKNTIMEPLVYFLSHLSAVIEAYALMTAYWMVVTRRKVEWQKWQRRGYMKKL